MEGGREANGAQLYIARVEYSGGVHTAKTAEQVHGALVAFSGMEVTLDVCINPMMCSARSVF